MSLLTANGSSETVGWRRSLECSLEGRRVISTRAETLRGRTLRRTAGKRGSAIHRVREGQRHQGAPRVALDNGAVGPVDDRDQPGEDGGQVGRMMEELKEAARGDRDVDVKEDDLGGERRHLRHECRLRAEDRADAREAAH
jgi:hypothetical protein